MATAAPAMPARFSRSRLETRLVMSLMRRSLDQTSTDFTDLTDFADACIDRVAVFFVASVDL